MNKCLLTWWKNTMLIFKEIDSALLACLEMLVNTPDAKGDIKQQINNPIQQSLRGPTCPR
jgi:hypothetical protein